MASNSLLAGARTIWENLSRPVSDQSPEWEKSLTPDTPMLLGEVSPPLGGMRNFFSVGAKAIPTELSKAHALLERMKDLQRLREVEGLSTKSMSAIWQRMLQHINKLGPF